MARVNTAFAKQFQNMKKEALEYPIVFVVDMVNGFVKEGALHDEAILNCVKPIQNVLSDQTFPSIFVADAHPKQTREFQSYPSHCVIGTSESDVIEELRPQIERLFHKNSTNTFTSSDFQDFLMEDVHYYQDIIITGCCTDICILQFALCLNAWFNEHNEEKKRIIIPIDCVDTYHIDGIHDAISTNEFALSNMAANGIMIVGHLEGSDMTC